MPSAALLNLLILAPLLSSPQLQTPARAQPSPLLAQQGEARAIIIVPDHPSQPVSRAAQSLAAYLGLMTSARFTIQSESATSTALPGTTGWSAEFLRVHVGPTSKALQNLPTDAAQQSERVFIQRIPEGIVLCGGGDVGTQFAIWKFLGLLGCRWLTPRPEDEIIPRLPDLALPESVTAIDLAPAFHWRLFKASAADHANWGTKLGFNGFFSPQHAMESGGGLFWPPGAVGVHTFSQIIPADQYFESHPEWFPLRNGRRPESAAAVQGQLCLSAPGLLDEFVRRTRQLLDQHPEASVISISPDDGYQWCECPNCTRLDQQLSRSRKLPVAPGRFEPFVGDRICWFCNQVAEQIQASHPKIQLLLLAYINYVEPPDSLQPAENIVPFVCHYWPADYSRPIADPSSPENQRFFEILQHWTRRSPNLMLYSYTSKSLWWRLPRPILKAAIADIRLCQRLGIRRFYCQSTLSEWEQDGPLYYVMAHLLWNPSADPEQLIDEWVNGMYGSAAVPMRRYYDALENSAAASRRSFSDDPRHQVPGLFDLKLFEQARRALTEARQLADSSVVHDRISRTTAWFEHSYWLVQILDEQHAPRSNPQSWIFGVLCVAAVFSLLNKARHAWHYPSRQYAVAVFLLIAAVTVALCWCNSLFDLQRWAIDHARSCVQTHAWYQSRFLRKAVFTSTTATVALGSAAILVKLLRGQWRSNVRTLVAILLLLFWQLLRATAFDQPDAPSWLNSADAHFRTVASGLCLHWIISLPALLLICLPASQIRFQQQSNAPDSRKPPGLLT